MKCLCLVTLLGFHPECHMSHVDVWGLKIQVFTPKTTVSTPFFSHPDWLIHALTAGYLFVFVYPNPNEETKLYEINCHYGSTFLIPPRDRTEMAWACVCLRLSQKQPIETTFPTIDLHVLFPK